MRESCYSCSYTSAALTSEQMFHSTTLWGLVMIYALSSGLPAPTESYRYAQLPHTLVDDRVVAGVRTRTTG